MVFISRLVPVLVFSACLLPAIAGAQTTTTTTDSTTSTNAQAQAIQQQITAGIENGTLSQTQIEELQAQELQLQSGSLTGRNATASTSQVPTNEAVARFGSPNVPQAPNNNSPIDRRTTTGPDPFTYNSLGPDAYQSQKYQNPAYNVPAYPTTDPLPAGTSQQYTGATAGAPYGAGYAQSPIPSGTGQGVYAPSTGTGAIPSVSNQQGVYVYNPGTRR